MTEMVEYILPIYSLSSILFFNYVIGSEGISALSWICLGIGFIHCSLPLQKWNEKLFKMDLAKSNTEDYYTAEKQFITDYERENPATQLISTHIFIKKTSSNLLKSI